MVAVVPEAKLRQAVQALLKGADLAATSVGKLRAGLEAHLKLPAGGLEAQKDEVNKCIRSAIVSELAAQDESKKRAAAKGKDKKAKKQKTEDDSDEMEEMSDEDAPAAADAGAAAPLPEAKDQLATTDPLAPVDDVFELENQAPANLAIQQAKSWALSGSDDGSLRLWDLEAFSPARAFDGHQGAVMCLAADWTEMRALSGGADGAKLWDLRRGGCQKTYAGIEGGCAAIKGNWDGDDAKVVAACGDGQLRIWDMKSGDLVKSCTAHKHGVWALDADWPNKRLASGGDDEVKIWNTEDWSLAQKVEGHAGSVMCLALDWSKKRVVIGASEACLRLWDGETKSGKNILGHRDAVACVCADRGKGQVLTAGWDAQLKTWNLDRMMSCTQSHDCKFGRIRCMAADFERMQVICGSSCGSLHMLDLYSGAVIRSMEAHVGAVTAVAAKF